MMPYKYTSTTRNSVSQRNLAIAVYCNWGSKNSCLARIHKMVLGEKNKQKSKCQKLHKEKASLHYKNLI